MLTARHKELLPVSGGSGESLLALVSMCDRDWRSSPQRSDFVLVILCPEHLTFVSQLSCAVVVLRLDVRKSIGIRVVPVRPVVPHILILQALHRKRDGSNLHPQMLIGLDVERPVDRILTHDFRYRTNPAVDHQSKGRRPKLHRLLGREAGRGNVFEVGADDRVT